MGHEPVILLHVGAGKTGTTSLQENVFARLPDTDCLWRPNHQTDDVKEFSLAIRMAEDHVVDDMCRRFTERARASTQKRIILSDETIRSEIDSLAAGRLARYFPDAHILITTRSQFTALPSYYYDTGRMAKRTPLANRNLHVTWAEFLEHAARFPWRYPAREFRYYDLAKAYAEHFENVTVLTFEEMTSDPDAFLTKLAGVLDTDLETLQPLWTKSKPKKTGASGRAMGWQAFRSKIPVKRIRVPQFVRSAAHQWLKGGNKAEVEMSDSDRDLIRSIYGEGNKALGDEFGVDLSKTTYPLNR